MMDTKILNKIYYTVHVREFNTLSQTEEYRRNSQMMKIVLVGLVKVQNLAYSKQDIYALKFEARYISKYAKSFFRQFLQLFG